MSARRHILTASVSTLAMAASFGAKADGFYAGLGLEKGQGELTFSFDTDYTAASVIAGYRHDLANNWFVGGEIDAGRAMEWGVEGGPYGDADLLVRARAIGGYTFGTTSVFGALGYGSVSGDLLDSGDNATLDGVTFGLGAEFTATDRVKLRIEAISDQFSGPMAGTNYDWDNTSVRAAALISF